MRCPVCRALVEQGPQCRRCRADLALLFTLEDQRRTALAQAYRCLARGNWDALLALAEQVHLLRRDEESTRLLACAYLLQRDFPSALQMYASREPLPAML